MSDSEQKARRNQMIVGLVMGVIFGVLISWLTEFWLWLPAGIVLGFVSGVLIKPPVSK